MREKLYFTSDEARQKVGRKIQTLVTFSGVPKDTTGHVTQADPKGADPKETEYTVAIEWDLVREKPLTDWFRKDEYLEFLTELPPTGVPRT